MFLCLSSLKASKKFCWVYQCSTRLDGELLIVRANSDVNIANVRLLQFNAVLSSLKGRYMRAKWLILHMVLTIRKNITFV